MFAIPFAAAMMLDLVVELWELAHVQPVGGIGAFEPEGWNVEIGNFNMEFGDWFTTIILISVAFSARRSSSSKLVA